ncbi:MAG: glycosyltransferase family 4 protein [Kordiimonadaceae bacterium]|nr:glycosyltransferase family 4 protein [Kordiimonadaceae bacterium]MBO6569961.1 glycosyltransferase family 4 protein [Kordiimonadaceae bacterium]MBO6965942.1 glycosyltransferase family 4 protein [Kordiimonadaceae bacterium]
MTAPTCLFVVTHYLPLVGGGQTVYDALCRKVPEQFQVLTSRTDYITGEVVEGFEVFDAAAPYKIHRVARTRPNIGAPKVTLLNRLKGFLRSRQVKRELVDTVLSISEQSNIDTICVGAAEAFTWLPAALKRRTQTPIIYYTHGEEFSQAAHSEKADLMRKSAINHADKVICVSSFTRDLLIERYDAQPEQIELIHNGVDFDRFLKPTADNPFAKPDCKHVVAAGRMVERKGFDKLVAAWPIVLEKVPDAKLSLAGKGPMFDSLKNEITQLGLEDSVVQLGFVSDEDLVALHQSADLFAMPNRTMPNGDTEGFGLVFLEAAAAGAPSVGGRAGGAVDAIAHEKTGLLVDGNDCAAIGTAIIELLENDAKRSEMASAAYSLAQKSDWSAKAHQFQSIVEGLANRPSATK